MARKGFCIFKKSEAGERIVDRTPEGVPQTYPTRDMAERAMARSVVERIMVHFSQGSFGDEEAITVRDHIEEVEVLDNGEVVDRQGNKV